MSSTPARGDKEGRPGEPSVQPSHSQQYSLSQQRQPHPPLPNHSLGVHGYHRSSLHQHQTLAGSSVPQGLQHPGYAHYPPQPPYPYSHPAVGVTMNTAYFQQPPWPQQGYPSSLSPPPSAGVNHPPVFNPQRPSTSASAPSSYAQHHPPPQQHSMSSPSSRNPPVAYPFANTSRSGSSTGGTAAKPKSSAPLNQNQIHAQTHPWRIKVYNACLACRKKKIKCDGQPTCNRCERLGYECSYVEVPHAPKDRDKSKSKTVTQTATSRTASQPSESPLEPITTHEIPTSHRTTPELHAIVPYTMSSQGQSKAGSGSLALSAVDNLRDINSRVDTRYASHPASARGDYPPIPTYKQSSESRASDQHLHTYQRNEYSTTSAEVFRSTNSVTRVIPSKKSSAFVLDHDASLPDLFHILTKAVAIAPPESKTSTSVPPSSSINNVQIGMDNLNIILITPVIPTITVMAPSSTDALYQLFGRLGQPSFRQSYVKDNDPSSAPPPDTAQQSSPNPSPQQIGHLVTNKNIIQYLVHVYFECFHPTWMIVDKKLFLAQLRDSHNPPDPLLLVAMCTAAAKYVDQEELCGEPGKMSTVGDQLLFHARILLQERFDIPSLPTVQALLILYWCQIHAGKASLRFMYIGMAIRMAQELELNRPLDAQEQLTIGEREVQIRKTIWWTCYQADRWTSAALGKPMVISDADCIVGYPTSLNSDEKPWIQHFRRLTELAKILGRIILNLYSATTANTCSSAVFSNLDQSLSNWYDSLPSALQYNIPSSSHPSVGYESLRIHRMGPSKTFTPPGGPKDLQSDIRMSSPANDTSSGNRSPSTSMMAFELDNPCYYALLFHMVRIFLYRPFLHNTDLAPILPLTLSSPQSRCRDSAIIISTIADSLIKDARICQQMFCSIHTALCTAATIHRFVMTSPKRDLSPGLMDTDSDRPSLSLSESASAAIKHDLYYLAVDLRIIQQFNRFAIEPSALRLLLEDFLPRSHLEEQELSWARAMIQQPIPTEPFSVTIPFPNLRSGQDTQSDHELSIQSSPPLHSQKTSVSIAAPTPSVTSSETKRSSHNKPNLRLTLPVTYFTAQQRNALKQQGSQSQVLPQTPTYAQEGQGGLVSRSQTPNASSTMKQQQRKQNQQDLEILQQQHQLQRAQLDQHHRQQTLILEQAQRSQQQQQQEQHEALMQQQQQLLFQQRRQSQQEQEQQSQVQEEHEQHKSQQRETRSAAESISTHSSLDRRNLSSDSGSMLNSRLSFGDTSPRTSPRQPGLQWGQKRRSLQSPHRSPQSRQFVQRQQQPDLHTHAQAQPQALFTAQAQAAANEFILEDTSLPAVLLSPSAPNMTLTAAINSDNNTKDGNVGFLSQLSGRTTDPSTPVEGNDLNQLFGLGTLEYYSAVSVDASQSTQASSTAGLDSMGGGNVVAAATGHSNPSTGTQFSGVIASPELMSGSTNQFWYPGIGVGASPTKPKPSNPLLQPTAVQKASTSDTIESNRDDSSIATNSATAQQQQAALFGLDTLPTSGPHIQATQPPSIPVIHPLSLSQAPGAGGVPYGYQLGYTYPYMPQPTLAYMGHIPLLARGLPSYPHGGQFPIFADQSALHGGMYQIHAPPIGFEPIPIQWEQRQQQQMAQQQAQLHQQQQRQSMIRLQPQEPYLQQSQLGGQGQPPKNAPLSPTAKAGTSDNDSPQKPLQQTLAPLQQTLSQSPATAAQKGSSSSSLPPLPQGAYREVRSYSSSSSGPSPSQNTGSSGSASTPSRQEVTSMSSLSSTPGSRSQSAESEQPSSVDNNSSGQQSASASGTSAQYDSSRPSDSGGASRGTGSSSTSSNDNGSSSNENDLDNDASGSSIDQSNSASNSLNSSGEEESRLKSTNLQIKKVPLSSDKASTQLANNSNGDAERHDNVVSGSVSGHNAQMIATNVSSLFGSHGKQLQVPLLRQQQQQKKQQHQPRQQQQQSRGKARNRRLLTETSGDPSFSKHRSDGGMIGSSSNRSSRRNRGSNNVEHSSLPVDDASSTTTPIASTASGDSPGTSGSPSAAPKSTPSSGSDHRGSSASSGRNGDSSGSGSEGKRSSARSASVGSGSSRHSSSVADSQDSGAMSIDQPAKVVSNKKGRAKGNNKRHKNKKVQQQQQQGQQPQSRQSHQQQQLLSRQKEQQMTRPSTRKTE